MLEKLKEEVDSEKWPSDPCTEEWDGHFFAVQKKKSINFFRNLINYKIRLSIRKQWNISLSDRKCWCVCAQKGKMKYDFSD